MTKQQTSLLHLQHDDSPSVDDAVAVVVVEAAVIYCCQS
jgi:hypothetical protein